MEGTPKGIEVFKQIANSATLVSEVVSATREVLATKLAGVLEDFNEVNTVSEAVAEKVTEEFLQKGDALTREQLVEKTERIIVNELASLSSKGLLPVGALKYSDEIKEMFRDVMKVKA